MKQNKLLKIFLLAAGTVISVEPVVDIVTLPATAQQNTGTARKRKTSNNQTTKPAAKSTNKSAAKKPESKKTAPKKQETSADVKRQQEATQKEIRQTEAQIKENERSVKNGLSELGKLEGDINVAKNKIATTTKQIGTLSGQISGLEKSITTNETELKRLREEYLKALKKMRLSRKKNSGLAFVFASENFNQALRRMRYLKQFSEWKDRQSAAIDSKTRQLKSEKESLGKAKSDYDAALKRQQREQAALTQQYAKQDAIVVELKRNGDVLKTHLGKKQAEANTLRNRIASLIAEEERKAAEERARQEAARKAEAERRAREEAARIAAEKAAAEKAAAEKAAAEKAAREAELLAEKARKAEQEAADAKAKQEAKKKAQEAKKKADEARRKADEAKKKEEKERKRKHDKKQQEAERKEASKESNKNYADARKRESRNGGATPKSSNTSATGGNFGSMRGSLPRPVSGSFRVTSRFGRQSYPGLPDVTYENNGIDAEVSAGASALAVFGGRVSSIFMLPGYNTVVIVNHGNYYTVYGNISSPVVALGENVKAGQALGKVAPDEDEPSHGSIHFEVWRNREKLNPLDWIR